MATLAGRSVLPLALACVFACGDGTVAVEDDVAVSIATPVSGAVVRRPDDVDPEVAGIQVDVVVRVEGALDGTVVVLGTSADLSDAASAQVVSGEAVFAAFDLPTGMVTLHAATATCNDAACTTSVEIAVVDSDTQVAIASPGEGDVVGVGDVEFTIVRLGGTAPQSCVLHVDGAPVGNFFWTNDAAPLVVASTLAAGEHVAQAFCREWLDTIPTQEVTFIVDGTAPLAPRLISEPNGPGSVDFDLDGAYINQDTTDVSADVGLQHDVTVTVDGHGESMRGWTVRLSVTPPGGVETFYDHLLDVGVGPADVTFDAVHFGEVDGDITFRVVVLDGMGRSSPPDSATLIIDRTPPRLVLTVPDPSQLIVSRPDDLEPATFDSVEVDFTVTPTDAVGQVAFQLDALPPVAQAVAPSTVFPRVSLTAGDYVATFAAVDVAGNAATLAYAFSVETFANTVVIETPLDEPFNAADDTDLGTPGLQADFTVATTGFADGSTVVVCSTIDAGSGLACAGGGFVVGSGVLTGDLQGAVATFTLTLADGVQTIHAEAFELDDVPHESSVSSDVLVDTVPPEFVSIDFPGNDAGNDAPGILRFAASELDVGGALAVLVDVSGLEAGQALTVLVDGVALLGGTSPFSLALGAGTHSLSFAMADIAGNQTSSSGILLEIDGDAGAVVVEPPTSSPYTVPVVTVGVTITDGAGGGTLVLERFADPSGGAPSASVASTVLASGVTRLDFAAFALAQGLNYLQATYTDAFGNVAVSARVLYAADAVGPTLTLGVRTAAGALQSCGSLASSCLADTVPFDSGTRRIRLDKLAGNPACGGFGACGADGTDLFFTLADCVNSDPSLESCPVVVRLQSRLPGDPDWVDVFAGTFTTNDAAEASILTDPEFEPGVTRELRLVTADSNHNPAVSNSVFLTLNFAGVRIVTVERLDVGLASTGDLLADDRYYGIAEDILDPATGRFQTNFTATLDAYGVTPTSVRLTVDNGGGSTGYEVAVGAPFAGVELEVATNPASPSTNAITVEAMCGVDACGTRAHSGIVADIAAPTYEFDRCALCANAVPMVSAACPAACGDTTAASNIAGPGNPAIWNLAQDADHDGGNGFNAQPILVHLSGIEDGRVISLETDLGSLAGNTVASDGCAGAPACSKLFALTASHLPGTAVRRIGVSFTDRAGNPAVPRAVRIDASHESIYARTDVVAPAGVAASACIGESTAIDAASIEGPLCAAACSSTGACDRTAASAALTFSAPGDDGVSGTVVSYVMGVAALGIPYGATTYTSCDQLTPSGPFETVATLPGSPQAGGGIEQLAVPDLFPHRDYCFLVVATDDVGNSGPAGAFVSRRKIPLVTTPTPQSFDGVLRDDAQVVGAFHTEPAAPATYGAFATSLPDLDGDGRDDFAVTQLTSGSVQLFLSTTPFSPTVTINAPAIAYSGTFGSAIAGGDFDGDGLGDLVICDPTLTTTGFVGAGSHGGALFLYYGVSGTGIARNLNTTNPQVPSYRPDATLLGYADAEVCGFAQLGDVTGDGVDDLVAAGTPTSAPSFVYVINGGDRSRLAASQLFYPPTDADVATGAISPRGLALGDFDADGSDEIAVADTADAVFIIDGGSPAALVFHPSAPGFATTLVSVRKPRGTAGDWLLVGATDDNVYVFATGFMSDTFPLASYVTLDNTGWDGVPAPLFGRSLASLGDFDGHGGPDLAVGPGFIYGFDVDSDSFAKRAILRGGAGFAGQLAGVRGYQPGSDLGRSALLVVQRGAARLFMFR